MLAFEPARTAIAPSARGGPGIASQPPIERPWWATALACFCAATVVFLVVRDLFVPEVRDVEVWLGFELRGPLAIATAPLHWLVFAVGAWAYWTMRPWVRPWASVYAFTIAIGHLVWNLTSPRGEGLSAGLAQLVLFSVPALVLLRARPSRDPPGEAE